MLRSLPFETCDEEADLDVQRALLAYLAAPEDRRAELAQILVKPGRARAIGHLLRALDKLKGST